jgi:hypothetical protein
MIVNDLKRLCYGIDCEWTGNPLDAEGKKSVMRIFLCRLMFALGSLIVLALFGCASDQGTLQGRIESKINNPEPGNVPLSTEHYNSFAQDFEPAWPFGPYAHN